MFRLSKISHHQALPALVIHEQCAEILLVWGHEISFLKVKALPHALTFNFQKRDLVFKVKALPHALTFNFQKRDLVPPPHQ